MAEANSKETIPDDKLRELLECSICQNVCNQPRILSCQHMVCSECIDGWIKAKDGQLWCPECNQARKLPDGGAESLPQSFRLNDVCIILREKEKTGSCIKMCRFHVGSELTLICYECRLAVCVYCSQQSHAGHFCADPKCLMEHAVETMDEEARGSLRRIDQVKRELKKNKEDGLDVIKDFTRRFEFARTQLVEEIEKTYTEKVRTLERQYSEVEALLNGVRSIGQISREQESVDVNLAVEQLRYFPDGYALRPKTMSLLRVEMVNRFMDMLFSDGETKCGKVVTSGVPVWDKSELKVITEDFISREKFELQLTLKDERDREVETERSTAVSVEVRPPNGKAIPLEVQKVKRGRFQICYTPPWIGWCDITATIYRKQISGSPAKLRVRPRGTKTGQITGHPSFAQPHDVLKFGENFVVVDKSVSLIDKNGKMIHSFANSDWYFYPYSIALHDQHFYVTAMKGQVVIKYTVDGKEVQRFGNDVLKRPTGIAVDRKGYVYVADAQLSKVLVFSPNLKFDHYVENTTSCLKNPWFIKFNSRGHLVVADVGNKHIQVLDTNSRKATLSIHVKHNGRPLSGRGVDVDRHDNIYVAAREEGGGNQFECIVVYGPDGTLIGSFAESPKGKGLGWVRGVHIAREGDRDVLFVVDGEEKCIKSFEL